MAQFWTWEEIIYRQDSELEEASLVNQENEFCAKRSVVFWCETFFHSNYSNCMKSHFCIRATNTEDSSKKEQRGAGEEIWPGDKNQRNQGHNW